MRFALWLIGLFGVAVVLALFASSNPGTVTVFWPPYRVDLSLNLVLLVLFGAFALVHLALRALAALLALPRAAERWRAQQRERALHAALFEALVLLGAGRWSRAAHAAQELLARLEQPADDAAPDPDAPLHAARLRALARLLLAESAHALRDRPARDAQLAGAQADLVPADAARAGWQQALPLRAAQWALDDRQPDAALEQLRRLPPAAARRTAARRLRLRAARAARQTRPALQEALRLTRHGDCADARLLHRVALEHLAGADSAEAVARAWHDLDAPLQARPGLAIAAARHWQAHGGAASTAAGWLWPAARRWLDEPAAVSEPQRVRLLQALDRCGALSPAAAIETVEKAEPDDRLAPHAPRLPDSSDAATRWRADVVAAQAANPHDPLLQCAAGFALLAQPGDDRRAQALLEQAASRVPDAQLRRSACDALAQLLERRGEHEAARLWREPGARD